MDEHPFQRWVEKTARYSGVLASGVRLTNQSIAVKSFEESIPEARLKEVLHCVAEVAFTLRYSQLGSTRLRWVFEHGQLQSARRNDGALAILILSQGPEAAAAVEELFAEFLATDCPAPPRLAFPLPETPPADAAPDPGGVQ